MPWLECDQGASASWKSTWTSTRQRGSWVWFSWVRLHRVLAGTLSGLGRLPTRQGAGLSPVTRAIRGACSIRDVGAPRPASYSVDDYTRKEARVGWMKVADRLLATIGVDIKKPMANNMGLSPFPAEKGALKEDAFMTIGVSQKVDVL